VVLLRKKVKALVERSEMGADWVKEVEKFSKAVLGGGVSKAAKLLVKEAKSKNVKVSHFIKQKLI
jgi:hypothetical protein